MSCLHGPEYIGCHGYKVLLIFCRVSRLVMYELKQPAESEKARTPGKHLSSTSKGVQMLTHNKSFDHQSTINGLSAEPLFNIFITTGQDGLLKVNAQYVTYFCMYMHVLVYVQSQALYLPLHSVPRVTVFHFVPFLFPSFPHANVGILSYPP